MAPDVNKTYYPFHKFFIEDDTAFVGSAVISALKR